MGTPLTALANLPKANLNQAASVAQCESGRVIDSLCGLIVWVAVAHNVWIVGIVIEDSSSLELNGSYTCEYQIPRF